MKQAIIIGRGKWIFWGRGEDYPILSVTAEVENLGRGGRNTLPFSFTLKLGLARSFLLLRKLLKKSRYMGRYPCLSWAVGSRSAQRDFATFPQALLHFTETNEAQTLEMLFKEGGDPLLFQSRSKMFAAELIMATMEVEYYTIGGGGFVERWSPTHSPYPWS